jgi:hypothetical protein
MTETRAGDRAFIVTMASAFLLKLWLTSQTRIIAAFAPHDASNYLEHAKSIAMGRWFGPYDNFTLIKQPFFPIYMAGLQEFGIPLTIAHLLLYGLACFTACFAVKPLVRTQFWLGAMFVVLYFNPMENDVGSWSTIRSQVNGSLALLTLACATGLFVRRRSSLRSIMRWSVALGASFAAFWLTREEAVWIDPALAVLLAAYLYPAVRERGWATLRPRLMAAAVPAAIWVASVGSIMLVNGAIYGWYTTSENMSPELVSAYDSLARIDPGIPTDPRFPVPHAARVIAYRVSAAARELTPYLEGAGGASWEQYGCQQFKACGDIHAGWFIWAFRDAVSAAGDYTSGAKARSFYLQLATEIDTACTAGTIRCRPKGHTLSPPLRASDMPKLAAAIVTGARLGVDFEQFSILPPYYVGPASIRPDYDFIVRSVDDGFGNEPAGKDDDLKRAVLVEIADAYQILSPYLVWLAILAGAARLGLLLFHRSRSEDTEYLCIATALLTGFVALIFILALVTTLSFPAFNPEYTSPLFPLSLFMALLITAVEAPGCVRFVSDRLPAPVKSHRRLLRNAIGGAIAVAFVAGLVHAALALRRPATAVAGAPAPAAASPTPLPGAVVSPSHRILSPAQLKRLTPAGPAEIYGVIESFSGNGPGNDQFPAGSTIFVRGWAGDPATKSTAAGLLFIVDRNRRFDATAGYGGDRMDVATVFKTMAMFHTNVAGALPTTGLAKGRHSVQLATIARDGRHYRITSAARTFTLN